MLMNVLFHVLTSLLCFPEQQNGGFSFILFDGKHRSGVYWFTVKLPEVGHILQTNARLVIAPKATMVLKQKHLFAQSSLANSSRVLYLVMESPKYGSLLVNGDLAKTFTQWDIDGGHVIYRQYKPVHSWITRDGFSFRLTIKGLGQDLIVDNTIHKFRILITYAAYEGEVLSRIVPTSTLRIVAGQKMPLTLGHVNISGLMESVKSPLIVSIARIPQYGKLELNGQEVTDSSSNDSTPSEISLNPKTLFTGNLTYEYLHNNYNDTNSTEMETLQDFMILEIYPEIDSGRHRKLTRLKIPLLIDIVPFWKNKVQMKRAPKWINVQKFGAYPITNEDLLVDCLSAKPTDIVYRLTRSPTNGRIIISRKKEDLFQKRISDPFFTQKDIDDGLVWFRHDGSAHESDFITFQVSNFAEENPGTITHTIKVLVEPSPLKLVNFSNILAYFQGKSEVIFRKIHLAAEAAGPDGLPSKVLYAVIAAPENGTLINLETRKSINR
uniref:Chondroitin sulfate proteoglycan 4 n=1 Tax=Romanomermis culicivorax TaxID=13658 RepID=A0A915IN27_ROMCU